MTQLRPVRAAALAVAAALACSAAVLPAGAAAAAPVAAAAAATVAASALPAAQKLPGDDGRRSFGVQPSGPKKVDARPNLTYRDVKPGQRLVDHVAVVNISDRPATLSVYAADAFNTPDGAFDVRKQSEKNVDLGSWVTMRRNKVTVPARSAFITPIELNVPKNAEPGDHAAAIVASLRSQSRDAKGNVVNRDDRVGTRMYVRVAGELTPKIELDREDASFSMGRNPLWRGESDVTYTVRNTGNVRLVGNQSVRVADLIGGSAQAKDIPALPELLPGNEFSFTTPVDGVLPTFFNTAHVVLDPVSVSGNVDPALAQATASKRFFAMSWLAVAILAILVLVAARFWWQRRRTAGPAGGDGTEWADGPGGGSGGGGPDAVREPAGVSRRVRVTAAAVLGLAAAIAPVATGSAAHAADGTLTFVPGKGADVTPMYGITSGACPKEGTNVVAYMFGKGTPANGLLVVSNQDAPVRHDGSFGVPLRDNLANISKEAGFTLSGAYRFEIRCVDAFATKTFATFTGVVTFGTPSEFTAPVPAKPPVGGVPPGYLAMIFPEFKAVLAADDPNAVAPSGPAAAPSAQPSAAAGAAPQAAAPAAGAAVTDSSTAPLSAVRPFLIGLVAVLALAAAGYLWTRRPTPVRAAPAAVDWGDDDKQPETTAPRGNTR